jgi:hypothetical protein
MQFSEKYELIESLTTGAVESFIGNNKARGERVLVHILQCEPQKANQPTVQWVLDAFRQLAPEPAGIVLEAGRYSGTTYAYLVTTLPENAELAAWVARYNAQNKDTQEFTAVSAEPSRATEMPAATPEPASPKPAQVPVQFTQIFRELDRQARPAISNPPVNETPSAPAVPADLPARPIPSFSAERVPSGVHASPKWDELAAPVPPTNEDSKLAGAVASSSADLVAKSLPVDAAGQATQDLKKAGEFTSFWQGPFRADVPAEIPLPSSSPLNSQNKPGEFTMMFRSGGANPEPPVFSPTVPEHNAPRSGMTGWATHAEIMAQTAQEPMPPPVITSVEAPPMVAPPAKPPSLSAKPAAPPRVPAAPAPGVFPLPTPPKGVSVPVVPAPEAASTVFQPPSGGAIPPAAPISAGPSAYTQIISLKRPLAEPPAAEDAAAPKLPSFAAPSKPAMAAPPLPKLPPVPKPPAIKAPKTPKLNAAKLDGAKPPVSYWPLVLTLTALFFLAVLLVLYFVLKH